MDGVLNRLRRNSRGSRAPSPSPPEDAEDEAHSAAPSKEGSVHGANRLARDSVSMPPKPARGDSSRLARRSKGLAMEDELRARLLYMNHP